MRKAVTWLNTARLSVFAMKEGRKPVYSCLNELRLHLADAFIQSDLKCIQGIHILVSTCVPWESNPHPLRC